MADDVRLSPHTESPADERLRELRQLLPEAFVEGKLDVEKLRAAIGDESLAAGRERYGLNWAGKSEAVRTLLATSAGTLRPCPEESVNFDSTENLIIEGDNLEVLKLLQKSYHGKVKLIYIDPPYNTGNDFIYADDFKSPLDAYRRFTGELGDDGKATTTNRDTSGRLHSNWLNMMYPRLHLARNLLREDGVIFVSIDDIEVHNLRMVMNEVFGEENFLSTMIWNKQHSQQQGLFKQYHEYVIAYGRSSAALRNISGGEGRIDAGALKKISKANPASEFTFPAGVRFEAQHGTEISGTYGDSETVTVISGRFVSINGKTAYPVTLSAGWTQKSQMESYFKGEEVVDSKGQKVVEFYFNSSGKLKCIKDRSTITPPTILPLYGMVSEQTEYLDALLGEHVFDNPKPKDMVSDFAGWFCSDGDLLVDFFGGSGTSAEAIIQLNEVDKRNRKFILVQLPEKTDKPEYPTIAHITRERVRRVIKRIEQQRVEKSAKADLIEEEKGAPQVLGFRALRLADSNFHTWDSESASSEPEQLKVQLAQHAENLVADRHEQDRLFELMLRAGLPLSARIEVVTVAQQSAWRITENEQSHLFCLAEKIEQGTLDALRALQPASVICLDDAFAGNDALKTNTVLQMKDAGIRFHTA